MAIWHREVSASIETAVDNADALALYRRWLSLRADVGDLPPLAAMAMDGPLANYASKLIVFEPKEDGYEVHFCGDTLKKLLNSDPTGSRLGSEPTAPLAGHCFSQAAAQLQPLSTTHFSELTPWVLRWEQLVLPTRDEDGSVWLVVFAHAHEMRSAPLDGLLECSKEGLAAFVRVPGPAAHSATQSASWQVMAANRAFGQFAQCNPNRVRGHLADQAIELWDAFQLQPACELALAEGRPRQWLLQWLDDEDGQRQFEVQVSPINGQTCAVRMADVTELQRLQNSEKTLRNNSSELEADNEQLRQLAWRDGLTGLLNRRALDVILEREVARCQRLGEPLSVIMCDIDHFKAFNDFYGHLTGDDCLREVGQILATVVQRATDMVARYGGEEFTLVLPNTDLQRGQELVQRVQQALHERGLPDVTSPNGKLLTMSFGLAEFNPELDHEAQAVLQRADAALYSAKREGRNRTGTASSDSVEVTESDFASL
jgi:diguanylate cyclase (GGDEF)-like protein